MDLEPSNMEPLFVRDVGARVLWLSTTKRACLLLKTERKKEMKTRIIHTKVWTDNLFVKLSRTEKLLFIFFITNERIGLTGAYECSNRITSFYTSIPVDEIEKAKKKLTPIMFIDDWIVVKKASLYNNYTSNEKLKMAYDREYQLLPEKVQKSVEEVQANEYVSRYRKSSGSYVHRKVAEKILGRKLLPNEIVHHIDKNPTNNNPLNLAVMDNEKHILLHKGEIHLDDTSIILVSDLYHTNHKYKIINHKSETINHKGGIEKLRNKIKELVKLKSI